MRHPTTDTWQFPPERDDTGTMRTNLRELAARPERFEHHLLVVGRVGDAQLELVTASEPLCFWHANVSDEYALALPTGDPLLDGFPMRTFFAERESLELMGRVSHRAGQLVLHPHGCLHWPGMLRPPFEAPAFPGPRRCGLSLVFCAATPVEPEERPLDVAVDDPSQAKAYREGMPFHLVDTLTASAPGDGGQRWLGQVGGTRMDLLVAPEEVQGPGYLLVLEAAAGSCWFSCDLARVSSTTALRGVQRALWFSGGDIGAMPPPSWHALEAPRLAPFEEASRVDVPTTIHGVEVVPVDARTVTLRVGNREAAIPRHWLARMLFRVALHDLRLGYVETYGGFFFCNEEREGEQAFALGLRAPVGERAAVVRLSEEQALDAVATLYRAVAPPAYHERLV